MPLRGQRHFYLGRIFTCHATLRLHSGKEHALTPLSEKHVHYEKQTTMDRLDYGDSGRISLGAFVRCGLLRVWAGFSSFQNVSRYRHAYSFYGRRYDHIFLPHRHSEFAKVSRRYTHHYSNSFCIHRHRDNRRALGIL